MAYLFKSGIKIQTATGSYKFDAGLISNFQFQITSSGYYYTTLSNVILTGNCIDIKALLAGGQSVPNIIQLSNGYHLDFVWYGNGNTNSSLYWFDSTGTVVGGSKADHTMGTFSAYTEFKYFMAILHDTVTDTDFISAFTLAKTTYDSANSIGYSLCVRSNVQLTMYNFITEAPEFTWEPYGYLSGNNGQFQMSLSQINRSIIGDGATQSSSADPHDFIIYPRTSLYNLSVNMLDGQEYTIAYCGDNYLTCTKRTVAGTQSTSVYLTLKFYFRSDTLIYTTPEIQITRIGTTAPNDYYLSIIYDNENEVAAPDLINEIFVVSDNVYYYNNFGLPSDTQMQALYIWLQDNGNAQSGDPYSTGSTDDGGDPNGPRPMDNLPDSSLPTTGGLNLSIVTLYTPTDTELSAISAFLWSNDVLDNFKKYFNNFADNILCLYSLPFKPSGTLPTKAFKVGNITSDNPTLAAVEYCTVRYFDVDMGSYELESKWGSYLDYSPYTKIEIYLPYIGLHSLDIDELMSPSKNDGTLPAEQGCTLSLVYRLDIITGIIVAKIKVNGQIRYQFTGKVGTTIPLTGQTYSNLVNSIITAGAGLATTIATGGLTAPMSAAATVTATIQAQKPQVTSVGNITGDASMLATDIPYLRISTPNKPLLEDQQVFTGFPAYKAGTLSDFTGYTEVVDAHVEGISCTEEERAKILTYLKDGVII